MCRHTLQKFGIAAVVGGPELTTDCTALLFVLQMHDERKVQRRNSRKCQCSAVLTVLKSTSRQVCQCSLPTN
jgi:hypothetical protein